MNYFESSKETLKKKGKNLKKKIIIMSLLIDMK